MRRPPEERAALAAHHDRHDQLAALARITSSHDGTPMPAHPGASDPTTLDIGTYAEQRAVDVLHEHGYFVVERNYRCPIGEIDIVAIDGDDLVFVEVRSRCDDEHGDAIESVSRRKRRMVTRTAEAYLKHRQPCFEQARFDVVAINGDEIEIYKDAWRGGLL